MKFLTSLPMKLLLGVIAGIAVGQFAGVALMNVVVTVRYILGQLILFCVPLIIIGFIAPSITRLGNNASKMLGVAVTIAYISSIGAALFSMAAGYIMIPNLSIVTNVEGLQALPDLVFKLDIPPIMSVMSALALSMCLGLAAAWTKAKSIPSARSLTKAALRSSFRSSSRSSSSSWWATTSGWLCSTASRESTPARTRLT